MAGYPVVFVASGGLPVTYSSDDNGWPVEEALSGLPVTEVTDGLPISAPVPDLLEGKGSFSSSTGATLSGLAAISGGILSFTGTGRSTYAVSVPPGGGTYRVTLTVLSRSAGDLTFDFANDDAGTGAGTQVFASRTPGMYQLTVVANAGNDVFRIKGVSNYVGSVDLVTVRAIS